MNPHLMFLGSRRARKTHVAKLENWRRVVLAIQALGKAQAELTKEALVLGPDGDYADSGAVNNAKMLVEDAKGLLNAVG